VLIDWFTVLAQIINFLILIYLLKRFLYGPITRAMEAREKRIAAAMDRARDAEEAAKQRSLELARERQAILSSKDRLLAEAKAEVDTWREQTLQAAREEVERLRQSWVDRLDSDRQAFLNTLKRKIAEQVMRLGDKVLKDLANQDLEHQVALVFLEKVGTKKDEFRQEDMTRPVVVQSGLALNDQQVRGIREQLEQWFPTASTIRFEVAADLGIGIQVVAGDRKVAWNLAEYLEDLEKDIMSDLFADTHRP